MSLRHSISAALLTSVLILSSCTYAKDDGIAIPDRFDEPNGPLAFADDSLAEDKWVVVNTESGLNLRAEPTTVSESLALLAPGEGIASTGHVMDVDGARWIEVRWGQTVGWVHSSYLAPAASATATEDSYQAQTQAGDVLVVVGDSGGTTLRAEPDGVVLSDVDELGEVTATGQVSGAWIEVVHQQEVGWIHGRDVVQLTAGGGVSLGQSETIAGPTGPAIVYVEDTDGLNLRSAPNGTIIGQLFDGSVVVLTGTATETWSEISYDNRTGWVSTHFLVKIVGELDNRSAAMQAGTIVTNTPGSVGVNIRDIRYGDVIATLKPGEYATVTGEL
ncbi:MAG: SH3 domain-containing protein, partial [Acidimicrobiales bacterium]